MNEKEVSELRRRLQPDRHNITRIYGCYVGDNHEIVSQFSQSLGLMPENESEKYLSLLRKALSGGLGRNLLDISFRTQQVVDSPEHRRLMQLRDMEQEDPEALKAFYETIVTSLRMEGSYLILLARDSYDVPYKAKDGDTFAEGSTDIFRYVLCAICPVKSTKPALRYVPEEQLFHDRGTSREVAQPELGFLFPAFDNRGTNLYGALYYTRSLKDSHEEFVDSLFCAPIPKPAAAQKEAFEALLSEALEGSDGFEAVQAVHSQLRDKLAMHKEAKIPEPLVISPREVRQVLEECGVREEKLAKFSVDCDSAFGPDAGLQPKNLIDQKRLEVKTPDVVIQVNPERQDLIQTRTIGGVRYILVQADESVEISGVTLDPAPQPVPIP